MNIEKYLILNKYLLSLFGVSEFRDLQEKLRDAQVGTDSEGRTHFINVLASFEGLKVPEELLLKYDENIQSYVKKINYRRGNFNLKYFQYLAILFTEIVLDSLKNRKVEFIRELNEFLEKYKKEEDIDFIDQFNDYDLNKLAFWMATGSGKTLIMHINYHQFFHYKLFNPDNIILITPNEGLSKQHFEELQISGIPSRLYTGSLNGALYRENSVLVIEMTKFVENKKGGGVTLPVDVFEGRNLIFVDEGHKGKKSEDQKWAKLRNKLAQDGFVLEYSATFGQILDERNKEVLEEYAKAILFDYSYKYFYLDGYGKDFSVLNVKQTKIKEDAFQEIMFVANLLSFYEQLLAYEENLTLAKEHNIEKPLWIFVGTTVTGKQEESDVVQIVKFIKKVIEDEKWLSEKVEEILSGNTGFKNENDEDVFKDKFELIRKGFQLDDLYKRVFGGRGSLSIYEIKNAEGEFGLRVGESDYFGVINIGDTSGFKKQLEKEGILIKQDAISGSLFDAIKRESSPINVLIGSKKFIEGWDTWRVSSMGLLNIGKGQGPQIIQLFGRGVRLKGKSFSLKRSGQRGLLQILETLNIYSIKADYLNKFLEAISKEEIEFETIEIPVIPQHEDKWKTLYTLTKDETRKFEEEKVLRLELDSRIYFTIDLLPKLSAYIVRERGQKGLREEQLRVEAQEMRITEEIIEWLNWRKIWDEICNFKLMRGYWNLIFDMNILRIILLSDRYKLLATPQTFMIKTYSDLLRIEEIAALVIRKYIDLFYRKYARIFETQSLSYSTVGRQLPLFAFEKPDGKYSYTVQIESKQKKLIEEIRKLASDMEYIIKDDAVNLPRIYFDKHLYLPILLQSKKISKISPVGLRDSERDFVLGLRDYLKRNKDKFSDTEVYLLRNYPKTGIGFQLQWAGFYPDFIMWIKKDKQFIIFIDPKGLEHTKDLNDEKIVFAGFKPSDSDIVTIKDIEKALSNDNIVLESFIISSTSYNELIKGKISPPAKEEYIRHHVLFLEDSDWQERLFSCVAR